MNVPMTDDKIIWLEDYTEGDIDPLARILDMELPLPYGFVIPHNLLHSIYLDLKVQQKLIPLFEFVQEHNPSELAHAQKLIEKTINAVRVPGKFSSMIHKAYEELLEKERDYLKQHTHDLHRAAHILKHIYAPPAVRLSVLPKGDPNIVSSGEQSLVHSVSLIVSHYLAKSIAFEKSIKLPSIMLQRVTNGQFSGYCETMNKAHNDSNQIIVYANQGAKMLDESADVYIIQKDGAHIQSRHVLTQPYKYVLHNDTYKKVKIHDEEGSRQALSDSSIMRIAYLAKDIEKKLYFPQKIYWTIENGSIFITKLRQI